MNQVSTLKGLGKNVAKYRKQTGLTQEKLADIVDVHRTYIGFIEQGKRNPSIYNLIKIARALDTTVSEILKNIA